MVFSMTTGPGLPPSFELLIGTLSDIGAAAIEFSADAARRRTNRNRKRVGATLRPGLDTPLWNAVAARVRLHLHKRGTQANLARVLGVPRQRVHDYFVAGSQAPDAERTLHVLFWLIDREQPRAINLKPVGTA